MKALPFITILLIFDTILLQRVSKAMFWWHHRLVRLPDIDPAYAAELWRWIGVWQLHATGLIFVCLGLLIFVWRVRLWHPWLAIGTSLLWIYMFWSVISHVD